MKKFLVLFLISLFVPVLGFAISPDYTPFDNSHVNCSYEMGVSPSDESLPQTELKSKALMWFRLAEERQKEGNVTPELCYGIAYAAKANASLESLGTSQRQLALVQKAGWRNEARMWLHLTRDRSKSENVTYCTQYVKENAALSSSSLESLGTSESELAALQVKGYRSEALVMIHISRERAKTKEEADMFLGYAKESAKLAGEDFEKLNKLPTSSLPPMPPLAKPSHHRQIGGDLPLPVF